jgi:catechol 2,3-dioxygenase-like lactoylglutathione lyase family enzyme
MKPSARPKRPRSLKHKGIAHVGLMVSNIERSRRFYSQVLGLPNQLRHKGVAYVPFRRDLLVLYDKDHGSPRIHFGLRVDTARQVDEWRDWLKSKGVRILEDVKEHDFRSIKFRDPDGHCIEISQER